MTAVPDRWDPVVIRDALPVGDYLLDELNDRGMTQAALAASMGRSRFAVNRLVRGVIALTPETAVLLEDALGISALTWLHLDAAYQVRRIRDRQA